MVIGGEGAGHPTPMGGIPVASTEPPMVIGGEDLQRQQDQTRATMLQRSRRW